MSGNGGYIQVQFTFWDSLSRIVSNNRVTLSFVGGVVFLYFATPTLTSILAGIPFIIIGEFIRTWSSGYIRKNEVLAQSGPYAMTRNPLYLGSFLISTGFSIMADRILLISLFLAAFLFIYSVTIQKEEKLLLKKFGDSFLQYKQRVPVFFPTKGLPSMTSSQGNSDIHFDWKLVIRHTEHHTWLGIVGGIVIFIVKMLFYTAN